MVNRRERRGLSIKLRCEWGGFSKDRVDIRGGSFLVKLGLPGNVALSYGLGPGDGIRVVCPLALKLGGAGGGGVNGEKLECDEKGPGGANGSGGSGKCYSVDSSAPHPIMPPQLGTYHWDTPAIQSP